MGVAGGEPAAVVDAGVVAVAAAAGLRLGEDDGAAGRGPNRRPFRHGDVDSGVVLVAGADIAGAEGRDDGPVAPPRPGRGPGAESWAAILPWSGATSPSSSPSCSPIAASAATRLPRAATSSCWWLSRAARALTSACSSVAIAS